MYVSMSGMISALSTALDYVESEVFGVTRHHSKRVAYMCVCMGREYGLSDEILPELAGAAAMHDNALTEYIAGRRAAGDISTDINGSELGVHAEMGERNMERTSFHEKVKGVVLYHHENADGSGPFGKDSDHTPFFAQLIHLADQVDSHFDLRELDAGKYMTLETWLRDGENTLFSEDIVRLFLDSCGYEELTELQGEGAAEVIMKSLPEAERDYSDAAIRRFGGLIASIIDFKSEFTSRHSQGIAEKAEQMGRFYGYSDEKVTKLYLAGAVHDIGKMAIPNAILEKPDKLTLEEFEVMKSHAMISYEMLSGLTDQTDVVNWACMHHEKLDGTGYPFGKTGAELDHEERLMGCIDIYQALTEERPYKAGMSHSKSLSIMREMAANGAIDGEITEDIDKCFG